MNDLARRPFRAPVAGGEIAGSMVGVGPPILLLHGGPGLNDYLETMADELSAVGTVAHYQQRGLAPSVTSGDRSIEGHTRDAIAILDALGWERACVVGHSWGGHFAMHLAVSHPGRLSGMVMVDALGAVPDGGEAALGENLLRAATPAERATLEAMGASDPSDAANAEDLIASLRILFPYYFARPSEAPPMPETRIDLEGHLATWDSIRCHFEAETLVRGLPGVEVPTVVLHGAASPIPWTEAEKTANLLPGAPLQLVPDSGHMIWVERPGVVREAVAEILG